MGGQHQRVDRPGVLRDTKGRQEKLETAGCQVIGGALTTLRVTGLMMLIIMNTYTVTRGHFLFWI